ncbi:ThiF family adenylyltransferase, partial [Streptomyces sp. DH17]|nr:ThiF family adenylyltransferase [Streptomyces sp. DH17]
VREIRLFDSDEFLTHNAFRAPGAPTLEELREAPKKVDYLKRIYSRMHRNIVAHDVELGADNLHLLDGVTFAFLSLDAGDAKRLIVEKLEAIGAAFVDVGMGLELDEGSLGGILRVTASTPEKRDHARQRISFVGGGAKDIYASNIQVADLNALNAVLAVVK